MLLVFASAFTRDRLRGNPQPFGGIQLVLCGDFYQLPPIGIGRGSVRFCFEAKTWNTSLDQSIVLKKVILPLKSWGRGGRKSSLSYLLHNKRLKSRENTGETNMS